MNIITIDLEDWFHIIDIPSAADNSNWDNFECRVERNTDRILQVLDERKIKATWFCLGWIAKKYPDLIKRISVDHEVGTHSMYHELLFRQDPKTASADIRENIQIVENLTGKKVTAYRAPGFSFLSSSKWLTDILIEEGVQYDCSVFPASRNHGGFSKFPSSGPCRIGSNGSEIKEFPMSIVTIAGKKLVFSGGGYFRLLPYPVISSLMNRSDYNMTYFHPRDFDPGQPELPGISAKRKFMSYVGLKKSFPKFIRLLNDHKFVSVEQAGALINWDQTPLIQIDEL